MAKQDLLLTMETSITTIIATASATLLILIGLAKFLIQDKLKSINSGLGNISKLNESITNLNILISSVQESNKVQTNNINEMYKRLYDLDMWRQKYSQQMELNNKQLEILSEKMNTLSESVNGLKMQQEWMGKK